MDIDQTIARLMNIAWTGVMAIHQRSDPDEAETCMALLRQELRRALTEAAMASVGPAQ